MNNHRQSNGVDIFSTENIKRCEKYVSSIQRKLDEVVADNNVSKIRWYLHTLTEKSRAVKILAVHHVTTNKGAKTAGIDGIRMLDKSKVEIREAKVEIEKKNLKTKLWLLENIDIEKKPDPIRRAYITKSNGKKRPLGILTLMDRVIQDILRMAMEPITEYYANDNSYGFRPKKMLSRCNRTLV